METLNILQQNLFTLIKSKLHKSENLAKNIAATLNVSSDAAYKKIKGDRLLDIAELQILTTKYKIPLADIDNSNNFNKVWFTFNPIGFHGFSYKDYLKVMITNLQMLIDRKVKYLIYSAKEVPMFYNFMFPELGCFKSFVWQKSILNLDEFVEEKFSIHNLDNEIIDLGNQIYNLFNLISSKEIWNYETVNCTLRQIDFYKITNKFADIESYDTIVNQYIKLINHIEAQTNSSKKINYHTKSTHSEYDLYHNELILGDNTVLIEFENNQLAFITPNAVNSFITNQIEVTSYLSKNFETLLMKSVQLNKQSEKLRSPFFEKLKQSLIVI
jgi:hypothetical protein